MDTRTLAAAPQPDAVDARDGPARPAARPAAAALAGPHGCTVAIERVTHRYASQAAVDDVSLEVQAGELTALLGPSGCGKTTLLRIVAGLLRQTEGHVRFDAAVVDALPANERGAGIVFQSYALFPHLSVADNVAYGLAARRVPAAARAARVRAMLDLVQMGALAQRLPRELSGGQQQRVALARTLAVAPRLLLLDEPFAALDRGLRLDMQIEIKRLQRELGLTTILVTHDQDEALAMADRIAVMRAGGVEQYAPPEAVYDTPATAFVAGFVGATNLLDAHLERHGSAWRLRLAGGARLPIAQPAPAARPGRVRAAIRPEQLRLVPAPEGLAAVVRQVLPLGAQLVCEVALADGTPLRLAAARTPAAPRPVAGEAVGVALAPDAAPRVFVP